jgi:pullulanase
MKNSVNIFLVIVSLLTTKTIGSHLFVSENLKTDSLNNKIETSRLYSDKELGVITVDGKTIFRLFAPNAEEVKLFIFNSPDDEKGLDYVMTRDKYGVWENELDGEYYGKFYNFSVKHEGNEAVLCLDPYAKAVATFNTYWSPRKGIVVKNDYDWEGDKWVQHDWRDLTIYEMHIKDMTAHPSSGSSFPGTYKGLIEKGKTGGINYIKELGINTVELLPVQEFANIEIPYNENSRGRVNTWNPYERNHWGYMTAAFFAPEAFYSTGHLEWNKWEGNSGRQVNEFKDMVKAFHKEGIAVVMDVVYNHISEYEFGNFKEIDKEYYFRLDKAGNYIAESYCGNDFKTEAPMSRRLIIESVLYWMKEYHIDGFRFDLGKLIDWETIEEIIYQAKKINPHVIIVCEPWGGGYDPAGFSLRGWGSWNDQIRNGIKGENPVNGLGWIFGKWYGNNDPGRIKSYVNGTLVRDHLGLFQKKEHSVNYLESHDGYTLGDFIRIGTGSITTDEVITDIDKNAKLTPSQLKLNKLAALFLFTSQGITMIHAGQEFGRSKVIPQNPDLEDVHEGMTDHNSYNKDNEVNYINYEHARLNHDLLDFYKGLLHIRKTYSSFRRAEYEDVTFLEVKDNLFAVGYIINSPGQKFAVLLNASPDKEQKFMLPSGKWTIIANGEKAGLDDLGEVKKEIKIGMTSGVILRQK